MTRFAGVDPGRNGAVAIIEDGAIVTVIDLKKLPMVQQGQILIPIIDIDLLKSYGPVYALREDVSGKGGQWAKQTGIKGEKEQAQSPDRIFSFGVYTGIVSYAMLAAGWEVETIAPMTWKSRLKLVGASDKEIYNYSEKVYDDRTQYPKRHDVTDSLLLAYLSSKICREM